MKQLFFIIFFLQIIFGFSQIDSTIQKLEKDILSKPNESLIIIDRLLYKTNSITDKQKADLLHIKGEVFYNNQNFTKAMNIFKESYLLYEKLKDKEKQIHLLNEISNLYVYEENFSEVIDTQNTLEKLLDEIPNKNEFLSGDYYNNMAKMHLKIGEVDKAKKYLKKAILISKKDPVKLHKYYSDLGKLFITTKKLDSAMHYVNKSLYFMIKTKDYPMLSIVYQQKGKIYELQQNFIKAEKFYQKSIKTLESVGLNTSKPYVELGNFYKKVHLYSFAEKSYNKAISTIKKTEDKKEILNLYHALIENALLDGKTKKARKYFEKYNALNKIIYKETQQKNIDYINKRYDLQEKELEFLTNKHELEQKKNELIAQKEKTNTNRQLIALFLGLLLVSSVASIFYFRSQKARNIEQKTKLKNKVLRLQMNPHFIFNSLTVIQNAVIKNNPLKSAEVIAVFSKLIRQILDFSNRDEISLKEELEMLTNYLTTQQFRFDNAFIYKISLDENIDANTVKLPPMLLQPFVENSIEHGIKSKTENGKIEINIVKTKETICFSIKDNGMGYYKSKETKKEARKKDEIHALEIFKNRLKIRNKNEEKSFKIAEIKNNKGKVIGTIIKFCLIQ